MPVYSVLFLIFMLASVGLPGLNGFVGEFLILLGTFESSPVMAAFAATGVILGAVYMLWMFQRVIFGPLDNPANQTLPDVNGRELAVMVPILVMIVIMGVYPRPFLSRMEPAVDAFVARIESARVAASDDAASHRLALRNEQGGGLNDLP
jgi:NADH-quinone oxidoreductase subunit M